MTTTHNRWIGEATAVAQVDTIRVTNSVAADVITITLEAEDGSTQAVTHTVADTSNNTTAAGLQSALDSSSLSLFQKINFTVATDTVTATAAVAGIPFRLTATDDGSTTMVKTTATGSTGPNDFNSAGNWSRGTAPTADDILYFTSGSSSVLYGLDQNGISLDQMIVGPGYTGNIGTDTAALRINADAGGEKGMTLGGSGFYYNISGDIENVTVTQNLGTLKLGTKIKNTNLTGINVGGTIELDCRTADNGGNVLRMSNVGPACVVEIPSTAVQQASIFMDSGRVNMKASGPNGSQALVTGTGYLCCKESGKINGTGTAHLPGTITVMGGSYVHESDASLASGGVELAVFNGVADFSRVKAATSDAEFITLGNVELYGGSLNAGGSALLVDLTSVKNFGGKVDLPVNSKLAGTAKVAG
tara:strand:- start:623 stop:1876 length:1254 start_codon:yes stop_codon:yes gene_type:complete